MLVDVIGSLHQLGGTVIDIGQQQPVLDVAVGADDHQQDALFREPQEFDLLEDRFAPWR